MAAMHLRRSRFWSWIRRFPRKKHLKDTALHRWLGDHIFLPDFWKIEERGVAAGVGMGLFWAMMPIPFQMIPAGISAFFMRVNIPATITSVWVTNPISWPFILFWQYQLGSSLLGLDGEGGIKGGTGALLLGCLVTGVLLGAGGWLVARLCWIAGRRLRRK